MPRECACERKDVHAYCSKMLASQQKKTMLWLNYGDGGGGGTLQGGESKVSRKVAVQLRLQNGEPRASSLLHGGNGWSPGGSTARAASWQSSLSCCGSTAWSTCQQGALPRMSVNTKMEHRTLAWVLVINERAWFFSVHLDSVQRGKIDVLRKGLFHCGRLQSRGVKQENSADEAS